MANQNEKNGEIHLDKVFLENAFLTELDFLLR